MNLGYLLKMAYYVLQDNKDNPRSFQVADLTSYINRGIVLFRQNVEDVYYRGYIPVVASQDAYDFPEDNVRAIRLAYDGVTMEPVSLLALGGFDEWWQTRIEPGAYAWSSDGLPHDQFRIYPKAIADSSEIYTYEVSAHPDITEGLGEEDDGCISELIVDGVAATFETDPADPGSTDPNAGVVISVTDTSMLSDDGEVVTFDSSGLAQIEIWGVQRPAALDNESEDIPIMPGFEIAPLWYCLWQTYLEEGERHDSQLAGFYQGLWNDLLARATERREKPLPLQVHVLYGMDRSQLQAYNRFSNTMTVDGTPITVRWEY